MIVWDRSGNTNCIFQLGKFSFLNILLICFLEYLLYIIWQIHTFMFIIYLSSILLQFPFLTSLMTLNHPLCLLPVFSFFFFFLSFLFLPTEFSQWWPLECWLILLAWAAHVHLAIATVSWTIKPCQENSISQRSFPSYGSDICSSPSFMVFHESPFRSVILSTLASYEPLHCLLWAESITRPWVQT